MNTVGWSIGQMATAACLLETSAPKPGNVHRAADFEDMTFYDMCLSAVAIGPVIQNAASAGVGQTVLSAVHATQRAVGKNTNLGTILLLAPLAIAKSSESEDIDLVLRNLTVGDAQDVFAAIRLVQPGGLGRVREHDVAGPAPDDLLVAMSAAADQDLIARQYVNGFADVLAYVPELAAVLNAGHALPLAIVQTQMLLMQRFPDSLIARKLGPSTAQESADRAAAVLASGQPGEVPYERSLADLDFWLRSDGHKRNPGTTADMIAAILFVALRTGQLALK